MGMEGTNNGSQSIWRVDFSWDDPALVAEPGVDPVVNRDLYNKLMEKPREENQAKCVDFLKKELAQNPTAPEKADYPKSDSAWEGVIDKFPFLNPALTSFSNGTVRPRTVFPVQRGNPNRVFTTTWHEGVVWTEPVGAGSPPTLKVVIMGNPNDLEFKEVKHYVSKQISQDHGHSLQHCSHKCCDLFGLSMARRESRYP
ncbi:MAG: hypothetical protein ACYC6Z_07310 [Thermoleophilia bacterium]